MRRAFVLASSSVVVLLVCVITGSAHASIVKITGQTFERSTKTITLEDDSSTIEDYVTDTEEQLAIVTAFSVIKDMDWSKDSTEDDYLEIALSATGVGTLPSIYSINSISLSGSTLTVNGVGRTFNSATDAEQMFLAVSAARLTPSGARLTELSGDVIVKVDLEESWIEVAP